MSMDVNEAQLDRIDRAAEFMLCPLCSGELERVAMRLWWCEFCVYEPQALAMAPADLKELSARSYRHRD